MFNYYNIKEHIKPEEIIMYLRKSRADDPLLTVEEVLSKHKALLDEWVEKNLSSPIPPENCFREIVSGGDSIADRPEFQKVLKLIESPSYKAVLVLDIPRLGRPDTEEIGRLTKIFRYTSCMVITPMMIFDITNEYERDMFERELKRGNEYLEYTKKILGRGRELSVKSGNYVGSKPVYGYDKIIVMDGKRKCPTLAINEEQANIVRMVFDWYVNKNFGIQKIANQLNDMNIAPPESSRWINDTIRRMLENPIYIGMVKWNQTKSALVVDNGEFRKTRLKTSKEELIYTKGKHEAIISEELFKAAVEKRGRNHRACANKELRNPFASILFCECGKAMSYRHSTKPTSESGYKGEPRLVCNGQHYCKNGSCSVQEMVDFIADLLKQKIAEFEIEANQTDEGSIKLQEKMIKNLEKKISDLNAKELSLWEAQIDSDTKMPPHIFQALTDKLVKEREDTEKALQKAREELNTPADYENKRVTLQNTLDALLDKEIPVVEKNRLLKICIGQITYSRGEIIRATGKGVGKGGHIIPPIDVKVKMLL